jgi:hypothetical protein
MKVRMYLSFLCFVITGLFCVSQDAFAALNVESFIDFENSSDGTPVTVEILNNSTHGSIGTYLIKANNGTTTVPSMPELTISEGASHAIYTPITVGGTTYSIGGTRGLRSDWGANNNFQLDLATGYTQLSVGMFFRTSGGDAWDTHDLGGIWGGSRYCYLQSYRDGWPDGHFDLHYHAPLGAGTGNKIYIMDNHWYWITWNYAYDSRGQLNVYDAENSYSLVGTSYLDGASGGSPATQIWIGATKYSYSPGQFSDYDNIVVSLTGEFPLGPGTGPNPDTTPPSAPDEVRDGTDPGEDIDSTLSTTQLSANWDASSDPESLVVKYYYAVGTASGWTDTVAWTDNGADATVTKTDLSLTIGTTYYFSVKAENGVELQSDSTSSDGQCVLGGGPGGDETPPVVSDISAVDITNTGATITWNTNEPATSRVQYGATAIYGNSTLEDSNLVTGHSVNITDLIPGIEYHYRVISKDSSSNEKISIDYTFKTPGNEIDAKVYPSPYNPSKGNSMRFSIDGTSGGEVKIYTLSGKLVKKLVLGAGESEVDWDVLNEEGNGIAAGLYIYSITDGEGNKKTGKLAISH